MIRYKAEPPKPEPAAVRKTGSKAAKPADVAPDGAKSQSEMFENSRRVEKDDALRIDPESRMPRPVQPDLA